MGVGSLVAVWVCRGGNLLGDWDDVASGRLLIGFVLSDGSLVA